MTTLDAMKQAFEVLTSVCFAPNGDDWKLKKEAESSLRTAIAEMEKAEPVGRVIDKYNLNLETYYQDAELFADRGAVQGEYLFTHPAQSRDSIIEECADVVWEYYKHGPEAVDDAIRALKGELR